MKTIKLSDKISIEPAAYATQGNAVLGLRGSGKSYSATYLAEQLMGEKIPFTAFDPIGVWRNLKIPGRGHGFPVVVVGDDGDLPLNQKAIPDIIRATMREGINLVIDLYSLYLSKADWRSIVENAVSIMLHENKAHGLRHIFVEEGAEFVPQIVRPDQAKVYSVFEKLARMGGNASLGYTLVNQRAEAVNKEILENCDMVFLHKQRGRNSVANLGKWLKSVSPATANEVLESLPNLKAGECWILPADSAVPQFVKMPAKQSFHPDRQNPTAARPSGKTVDVTSFVEKLKAALPKPEEKKAAPVKASVVAPQPIIREVAVEKIVEKIVEVPVLHDADRKFIMNLNELILELSNQTKALVAKVDAATMAIKHRPMARPVIQPIRTVTPKKSEPSAVDSYDGTTDAELLSGNNGARRMAVALAQRSPLTKSQLSVRAQVSRHSSSFRNSLSRLRVAGYVDDLNESVSITEAGRKALGSYEPLPEGQALLEYYLRDFGESGAARILRSLAEVYPNSLTREQVSEAASVELSSSSFRNSVSLLNTLELITKQNGQFRASDEFFQ
jgi:uncharacterized protein